MSVSQKNAAKKNAAPPAAAPQAVVPSPESGPKPPAAPEASQRKPLALLGPVPFNGKVIAWKSPVHNERILIAYLPGTDPTNPLALVTVRLRSNRNFIPGMELPVRQIGEGLYELTSLPPRWRGRW